MKVRPLQDRVLIRPVEPEARTSGGIIIPETAQEKPMEGEVVAAGPGARDANGACTPLRSRPATVCCSGSGREAKSSLMTKAS